MPYLILKKSDGSILKQWEFRGRVLAVGRGEKADVVADDQEMSRLHFTIRPSGSTYVLEDCQSHNGTFLNGQPVQAAAPLKTGDRIRAGQSQFVFEDALQTVMHKLEKDGPGYSTFIRELSEKKPKPSGPPPA